MSIQDKKERLIADLSVIEDPYERFAYVIDIGKNHAGLKDELKIDSFKIDGCTSNLWIVPEFKDGLCHFHCDADSSITKGVAALLCDFYSDEPPASVLGISPDFLGEVGITQHLSSNRRNGLTQIWNRIRSFAESCAQSA